jgi:hypothetical protein
LSLSASLSRSPNLARRRIARCGPLPHAHYGVDLANVPDTYVEPFVAYRAWNWTTEGITSLNGAVWTPKVAFEATCHYADDGRSMQAAACSPAAKNFWERRTHHVPDATCTCGMYAGINMRHLIDIRYIGRGIHGEVSLWGRLHRHTLGWRAQYAYPKYFTVPANMIPLRAEEALKRLAALVEFDVDIYLQPEREAKVGQQTIPLWVKDYGYSGQGTEFLIARWKKWNSTKIEHAPLAVGDRVAVFSNANGGGIGVVKEISGDDVYYALFSPNVIYHKKIKDVVWNEPNWRWETNGLGSMRKLAPGGDRCLS